MVGSMLGVRNQRFARSHVMIGSADACGAEVFESPEPSFASLTRRRVDFSSTTLSPAVSAPWLQAVVFEQAANTLK